MSTNRPPTVSEIVGAIDVPIRVHAATHHNIDVLWKPTLGGAEKFLAPLPQTATMKSCDVYRSPNWVLQALLPQPPTMIPDYSDFATDKGMSIGYAEGPRVRRMSLSEMIFRISGKSTLHYWSEKTMTEENVANKKSSVTEVSNKGV
ncbi:unnamed protein product, partial [Mesorhabditis belari]|uniref:Uncharacterized protein n=1 Tax=Mesorhabditis belari TaxID=2138241 RepID=A0AAF3FQ18_9BILA